MGIAARTGAVAMGALAALLVVVGLALTADAQDGGTDSASGDPDPAAQAISAEQAEAIATADNPGTVEEVELESEDGVTAWEVEIVAEDGTETEVEVDSTSGEILEVEVEVDDDDEEEADDEDDDEADDEDDEGHQGDEDDDAGDAAQ